MGTYHDAEADGGLMTGYWRFTEFWLDACIVAYKGTEEIRLS